MTLDGRTYRRFDEVYVNFTREALVLLGFIRQTEAKRGR